MRRLIIAIVLSIACGACDIVRPEEKAVIPPPPTNALCGRCSARFLAGWATTCRCPACGFVMQAKLARRAHGPVRVPKSPVKEAPTDTK